MLSKNIFLWVLIVSCFVGESLTIRFLNLVVLFPVRLIVILSVPFVFKAIKIKRKGILGYTFRVFSIMFVCGMLSLFWSPDPLLGIRILSMFLTGFIIFLIISRYTSHAAFLTNIMVIWSIMTIFTGLLGLYEMFSGKYIFKHVTDFGSTNIEESRILELGWLTPRSFLPGPNEFAFFNALSSLLLLGWMFHTHGIKKKLAFVALFISLVLLINSFSRAAIGGFFIGLFVFAISLSCKAKMINRLVLFLVLLFGGLYISMNVTKILDSIPALALLKYKIENQDNSTRLFYAHSAFYYGTLGSLGIGRGLGASSDIIEGGSYHNYLLEILAEYGFWQFLAYIAIIIRVCIQQWKAINLRRNIYWSAGILATCVAFPVLCSGPATVIALYPYWLWLAFIVGFSEHDSVISSRFIR